MVHTATDGQKSEIMYKHYDLSFSHQNYATPSKFILLSNFEDCSCLVGRGSTHYWARLENILFPNQGKDALFFKM